MTFTPTFPRSENLPVGAPAAHRFALGQVVRLKRAPWLSGHVYRITAALPSSGASPQYRIRSEAESFERMAAETELAAVTPPSSATDALIADAFGPGLAAAAARTRAPASGVHAARLRWDRAVQTPRADRPVGRTRHESQVRVLSHA